MRVHTRAIIIVLGTLLASNAAAQERSYESLVQEGLQEFELGHWREAQTLIAHAHELRPGARTLRALGMIAFELRHYVDSEQLLQQSLDEQREVLTGEQRADVEALLVRARTFVGEVQVTLDPADAELAVDDRPTTLPADGRLRLVAGAHRLVATAAGHDDARRALELEGGERLQVTLTLRPAGAPAAALRPDGQRDGGDGLLSQWWFWTAAGVVAAGGVIAIAALGGGGSEVDPATPGDVGGVIEALGARP